MNPTAEPELHYLEYYEDFLAKVRVLSRKVREGSWMPDFVIGVGRGGLAPGVYISHQLELPMLSIDHSSKVPGFADELLVKVAAMSAQGKRMLFVDDINDSGGTIQYLRGKYAEAGGDPANMRFAVVINNQSSSATVDFWADMIDRADDKRWFVFPWEAVGTKDSIVEEALSVPERLS
ncbi:phosphoribosyltransferase [Novosphingobium album (ex Hu et al. 2023)]|uniref:Phosphoribosyltransferase domain-containing protein n=1 Tax=Novosphingobium album (ex Hu et al. 2023) TaxID=2930093 RepID=A0ABT0B1T7_9SPHN|nr:phosphoribosyltransferase family protein [Novosphingobium album (ex Hu et al. 2023)]MCJ2179018.1 phosphoribosyltransferase domain-containing protein [Novosphingobium album (ex Hu et al. 2023)]